MRYRIYNKKSDFKIKKFNERSGKAVDCGFCRNLLDFFVIIYNIEETKTEEERKMRGGDKWIRLQRKF